ncbi:MAG TPA: hypothetical protein VJT75_14480 [Thermoleophilaceae bacterium]|nr:hypothetical protein [Thermoleophilaceae bacterium]
MDDRTWQRLFDEVREESRRNRERYEEVAAETHGVFRETVRALRALTDQILEHRAESRAHAREERAEREAHREGLFRLIDRIDRLDPGDSPA